MYLATVYTIDQLTWVQQGIMSQWVMHIPWPLHPGHNLSLSVIMYSIAHGCLLECKKIIEFAGIRKDDRIRRRSLFIKADLWLTFAVCHVPTKCRICFKQAPLTTVIAVHLRNLCKLDMFFWTLCKQFIFFISLSFFPQVVKAGPTAKANCWESWV